MVSKNSVPSFQEGGFLESFSSNTDYLGESELKSIAFRM